MDTMRRAPARTVGTVSGAAGPAVPPGPLGQVLLNCAADRASGVLHVTGEPGGAIHLADGLVIAISSPGAPDPEAILLRSGRVQESSWSAVFAAAAPTGRMAAELVRRGLVGRGELEALLRIALGDAMFTLAAGLVDECRLEPGASDILLPLEPGLAPQWLLSEAFRRIEVLATLLSPIAHDRDRVTAVQGAWKPRAGPSDGRAEILALANGRRTARDMAFVLGRGVYGVTLQLSRMRDAGLLVIGSSRAAGARRAAPARAEPGPPDEPPGGGAGAAATPPLPRRRRAASGQAAARPALKEPEKPSVLRLLRPGSSSFRQTGKGTP
jgi:hypothetical protein